MYSKKLVGWYIILLIEIMGIVFEGLFICCEVVEKIGFFNKDFFIFCDDIDYCFCIIWVGYKIFYIFDVLMDKEKFFFNDIWNE